VVHRKFKFTPYARIVPTSIQALAGLTLPPGYDQNLEIWYTADAPAGSGNPFDRGLQELGEMDVTGTVPAISASIAPGNKDAWCFDLTGRFIDEDESVSVAAEPFTMALICRVTGAAAVQDAFRAGAINTPYIRAVNSAGTVRYRPDGSATEEVDAGFAVDTQWHVVVYHRSGSLDQIYSAMLGEDAGMSGTAGAVGSTDLWTETELGGIGDNEFDGYIAQAMAWSGFVDETTIWTWAAEYYGFDVTNFLITEGGDFFITEGGDFMITE